MCTFYPPTPAAETGKYDFATNQANLEAQSTARAALSLAAQCESITTLLSTPFAMIQDENRPNYVIASHRWISGFETTFKDVRKRRNTEGIGYKKVQAFAKYIKDNIPSVEWLWIDTCCINKEDAAELSKSLNLMFDWYRNAVLCIAYLADVETAEDKSAFEQSAWFKRGWTLQELLAPYSVLFVSKGWQVIGNKGASTHLSYGARFGRSLEEDIAAITGIPKRVLEDYATSSTFAVEEKLKWMEGRTTAEPEDMSYALYGILNITLGANYGEKYEGARERLLVAIRQRENVALQQTEQYRKIAAWLSPPDPWTNHESARQLHEPQTGTWLLRSDQFREWRAVGVRHLWVNGKAGCGKTVLCSTAIEDVKGYCHNKPNAGYAVFYFSFSDDQKQRLVDLLRSLVVQLGWKGPALSMLQQLYNKPNRNVLGVSKLEEILLACFESYDKVFLLLDALDECPEEDDVRHNILEFLDRLSQRAQNIRIFATSREVSDIYKSMLRLEAESMGIAIHAVDEDIRQYVATQLSRDYRLSRLDWTTKALIEETISVKADGMFRWAYCQLQELKKLKATKPKYVRETLRNLPTTLDATYERILNGIGEMFHREAIVLLCWLAYAQSPPSLGELAEAVIVDPTAEGLVEESERGALEDTLEILSGLVVVEGFDIDATEYHSDYVGSILSDEFDDERSVMDLYDDIILNNELGAEGSVMGYECDDELSSDSGADVPNYTYSNIPAAYQDRCIGKDTKVRLAHFSVKEYLESKRILQSEARDFHLDSAEKHRFLAESCLVYLMHYSKSNEKSLTNQDLVIFPLLQYSAKWWIYHSSLQQPGEFARATSLLSSESAMLDWLRVHQPDKPLRRPFKRFRGAASGLYYASHAGLETVVGKLLGDGADVNSKGNVYYNALQAASARGHEKVVRMLLDAGANINAQGRGHGSALQAALFKGYEKVVRVLLDAGADVNAEGGHYGNALQASSFISQEKVVRMLLDAGADVNAHEGYYNNVLQIASFKGYEKVVQMLLDAGADVNAHGGSFGNALQAASWAGNMKVVQMLLDVGAEINIQGGEYGNALRAALLRGHDDVVQILIERGVDVNASFESFDSALCVASKSGDERIVRVLLGAGADANEGGSGNALRAASEIGKEKVVQVLIEAGADVHAHREMDGNALQAAASGGHKTVVQLLLNVGADINAPGGVYGDALQQASLGGHEKVVRTLIDAGACVNTKGGCYGEALQAASGRGHEKVVHMLMDAGADVNAGGGEFGSALQAAMHRGCEKLARMLIEHGAHVHDTALESAARKGNEALVGLLLDRGANINAQTVRHGGALQAASLEGHEMIVQTLLKRGADVNAQGGIYGSALQAALLDNFENIVKMLLEYGADVNARGGMHSNPLQAASAEAGDGTIVKMLIERGANVNAQGGKYGNALQAASLDGNVNVVKLLLDAGADANAQGWFYEDAAQKSSKNDPPSIEQVLFEQELHDMGVDTALWGGAFGSPLQAASVEGHEKVVRMLLDTGADVNAQGGRYGNALQAASVKGHEKVVRMLLDAGADVKAYEGLYSSALQATSRGGYEKVLRILLDAGADVNVHGGRYGNALQAASVKGHEKVVRMLLDAGADVKAQGGKYGNALRAASIRGQEKVVQMLMDAGAQAERRTSA